MTDLASNVTQAALWIAPVVGIIVVVLGLHATRYHK